MEIYTFEYNYLDRRQQKRGKTVTKYSREKAKSFYNELIKRMKNKEVSAPIGLPHITKLVDGETKLVNADKEFI